MSFFFFSERAARARGGGGDAARLLLFSFPCSADHERDWPPCKIVVFGLATNALTVRNNNSNNNNNLAGVSPIFENTKRIKKSVQSTQKVVQLQKSGTSFNCLTIFKILHHMNSYWWKIVYEKKLELYNTRSPDYSDIFQKQATYVCLLD